MRHGLFFASILFLSLFFSTPRTVQAASSAGHYAGGAALVIYMFGGLDIFGLQAPQKKTEAPSLADQVAAGSRNTSMGLGLTEKKALGRDRRLAEQVGR